MDGIKVFDLKDCVSHWSHTAFIKNHAKNNYLAIIVNVMVAYLWDIKNEFNNHSKWNSYVKENPDI